MNTNAIAILRAAVESIPCRCHSVFVPPMCEICNTQMTNDILITGDGNTKIWICSGCGEEARTVKPFLKQRIQCDRCIALLRADEEDAQD